MLTPIQPPVTPIHSQRCTWTELGVFTQSMANEITYGSGVMTSLEIREAFRQHFARVGTGWRVWSKDKRSIVSRLNAQRRWELRRLRYGPTGHKAKRLDYGKWRRDHGYPPVIDDSSKL